MAYSVGPSIVAVGAPGDIDSTARNPVGTTCKFSDGNTYIYLSGAASIAANNFVTYDEAYATVLLDTDTAASLVGGIAIATAAVVAAKYGWFFVEGSYQGTCGTVSDNGKVYATSTAGSVDDARVADAQIVGAIFRSGNASGTALVQFVGRPWIGMHDSGS